MCYDGVWFAVSGWICLVEGPQFSNPSQHIHIDVMTKGELDCERMLVEAVARHWSSQLPLPPLLPLPQCSESTPTRGSSKQGDCKRSRCLGNSVFNVAGCWFAGDAEVRRWGGTKGDKLGKGTRERGGRNCNLHLLEGRLLQGTERSEDAGCGPGGDLMEGALWVSVEGAVGRGVQHSCLARRLQELVTRGQENNTTTTTIFRFRGHSRRRS